MPTDPTGITGPYVQDILTSIINVSWGAGQFLVPYTTYSDPITIIDTFFITPHDSDATTIDQKHANVGGELTLAYAEGMWVVATSDGRVYSSTDLINFTLVHTVSGNPQGCCIAAGKPKGAKASIFVVGAKWTGDNNDGIIATSLNLGRSWTEQSFPNVGFVSADFCIDAFFIGGYKFDQNADFGTLPLSTVSASPNTGMLLRSIDGVAWSEIPMGAPETFVEFGVLANLYIIPVVLGVAAANIVDKVTGQSKPVYVVAYAQPFSPSPNTGPGTQSIGYKLATATSSNGQSWSDGAIIDASAPANGFIFFTIIGGSLNLNQHQRTVCFGNGVFCLIGGGNAKNSTNLPATWLMGDPAVFTSADGKDWSQNILPNNLPPNRNAFNLTGVNFSKTAKCFWAVLITRLVDGTNITATILRSKDGKVWTTVFNDTPVDALFACVAVGKLQLELNTA